MREKLSSRLGFLMLAAGCAVGLGNVWRFPYIVGKNGGAVFVLFYLFFLMILGLPLLIAELSIGRGGGFGISASMRVLGKRPLWGVVGFVIFLGNILLMSYYTDIAGWLLRSSCAYISGCHPPDFCFLASNNRLETQYMLIIIGFASLICLFGVVKGVERVSKVMMVLLLALISILAIRACLLPGAMKGISFYLKPDWHAFMSHPLGVITDAMGQAFFTLSIGIGAMTIFGSYIDKTHSLVKEATWIIIIDTFVAIMSGFVVFPACAAYGVDPGNGPGLIFMALPKVFAQMSAGYFWGAIFFIFLVMAAFTTIVAVFECIIGGIVDTFHVKRANAVLLTFWIIVLCSLPCIYYDQALGYEDFILSNIWLPLGALGQCIFISYPLGWGWSNFRIEASSGKGIKLGAWMKGHYLFVVPILIIIVALGALIA